jgi:hypothetical protein
MKQQALQVRGPVEFPKWVTFAGKPELVLSAEHEAELRNRAGAIDPAPCEPRQPGAEGDQISEDRPSARAGESTSDSEQLVRTSLERIDKPHVLLPFDIREALSISDAARIAGRTTVTVRTWAANFDLGRPVGGRWMISRVALAMFLESDRLALTAYLSGDRESRVVVAYFARFGLDPKKIEKERIN